ncbi:MAG: hypothetical protein RBS16_09655 [Candidatus Cloacimonadales bacterium]|jgi:CRISPR-associated protein Csm4|nr:hypothetical protein [Candidatus Cloacimonadales bacterium]
MKNYEIKWTLNSPLSTELDSDTIFGHFCWSLRYLKGKDKLVDFLDKLKAREVSFVLSNGFQDKLLPMPKLPLDSDARNRLQQKHKFRYEDKRKEIKSMNSIPLSLLKDLYENISLERFIDEHYSGNIDLLTAQKKTKMATIITHNTINRLTGTTSADMENLYQEITQFYPLNTQFYSWLKTDYFDLNEVEEIFIAITNLGYGKNKNIGKGNFDIEVSESDELLPVTSKTNAWLLLSNCVPNEDDTTNVLYNSKVKFGKLGGNYALKESPFKHPIFMFTPGSLFISTKEPKGSILDNVHPFDKEVLQNLSAYSIPISVSQDIINSVNGEA